MKFNKFIVDWLGDCPACACPAIEVSTQSESDQLLYEGDKIFCTNCREEGEVSTDGEFAYAEWANN